MPRLMRKKKESIKNRVILDKGGKNGRRNRNKIHLRWIVSALLTLVLTRLLFKTFIKEGYALMNSIEEPTTMELSLIILSIIGLITFFIFLFWIIDDLLIRFFDRTSLREYIKVEFTEKEYDDLREKNKKYAPKTKIIDDFETFEKIKKYIKRRALE
mgnify:CR=1 FL=1